MSQDTNVLDGELVTTHALSVDKFGRPSKLTDAVMEKARQYLRDTTSIAVQAGGLLPTKERLALTLGVSRQTVDNWKEQSPDFLDICNTLDEMQADMLVQNGLVGRYTPAITAIMLSKHGYVRKEESDNTHRVVQPIMGIEDQSAIPGNNSDT
jgi:hypothetical protein